MSVSVYRCQSGHDYLYSKECPFCFALKGDLGGLDREQLKKDGAELWFTILYEELAGKSPEEIEAYYLEYLLLHCHLLTQHPLSAFFLTHL